MNVRLIADKKVLRGVDGFMFLDSEDAFQILNFREVLVAFEGKEPVGVLSFVKESFYDPSAYGVSYVTVRNDKKGLGIGKELVKNLFDLAKKHKKKVRPGLYQPEGEAYIKHVFERFSEEFDVELVKV